MVDVKGPSCMTISPANLPIAGPVARLVAQPLVELRELREPPCPGVVSLPTTQFELCPLRHLVSVHSSVLRMLMKGRAYLR